MSDVKQSTTSNDDERTLLSRGVLNILEKWGLNAQQTVAILDLPEKTPTRMIRRYRDETPLPDIKTVNDRIDHILGIADALRTSWPHNPSMGLIWMKQKNSRFDKRAPVNIVTEDGLDGIVQIRCHLDCSYDWFND